MCHSTGCTNPPGVCQQHDCAPHCLMGATTHSKGQSLQSAAPGTSALWVSADTRQCRAAQDGVTELWSLQGPPLSPGQAPGAPWPDRDGGWGPERQNPAENPTEQWQLQLQPWGVAGAVGVKTSIPHPLGSGSGLVAGCRAGCFNMYQTSSGMQPQLTLASSTLASLAAAAPTGRALLSACPVRRLCITE